jgi:nitrous oxidase accessory protein NosD
MRLPGRIRHHASYGAACIPRQLDIVLNTGRNQMKLSFMIWLAVAACLLAYAQTASPRMISVEPQSGKAGDTVAVTGENLAQALVAKVFLTDGKNDTPVTVTEQTDTTIKFTIPKVTAGRLTIMVLTTGKDAKYIEQPVKLTIQE